MLRYFFIAFLFAHCAIHTIGLLKAFSIVNITPITREISKPVGLAWMLSAILFIVSAFMYYLKKENWMVVALLAVVISQVLIILVWKDARYGTIANVIIFLVATLGLTSQRFEANFYRDVTLIRSDSVSSELIQEADIQALPEPLQKYLRYTGVLNTPKVKSMRIVFDGEMRDKGKEWFIFRSVQYNFFDEPTRLFFMKARMFGTTVSGYHRYQKASASMDIRLFGLMPIVQVRGTEMNKAETVTVFNDMCIMAPASLIDKRLQWEAIDERSVKGIFTNGANKISAILYFNEIGQLVNFISGDRYDVRDMKQYRFSTPMKDYQRINGINVPTYGEAIWHYPEGEFVYGKFKLVSIEYNLPNEVKD
jgi:hypothetical protein